MTKAPRIHWSPDEMDAIAERVALLATEHDTWPDWRLVAKAQTQVIPKERWRKVMAANWVGRKLATAIAHAKEKRAMERKLEEAKAVPTIVAPPPPPAVAVRASRSDEEAALHLLTSELEWRSSITEKLSFLIGQVEKLSDQIKMLREPVEVEPIPDSVRDAMPRIAVVGALPAQAHEIARYFQGKANLTFPDKNASTLNLTGAEWVVIMTNFVSHSLIDNILRKYARDNVLMASGGVSAVKTQIHRVLDNRGKTQIIKGLIA